MAYTYYHKRIEQGLCGRCGKQPYEPNKKLCEGCRNINLANVKKSQEFRIEMGFCPKCGKEKLYGNEKICLLCKCKNSEYISKLSEEQLVIKRERDRQYATSRRILARQNGLCGKCCTRKSLVGKNMCGYCIEKERVKYLRRKEIV